MLAELLLSLCHAEALELIYFIAAGSECCCKWQWFPYRFIESIKEAMNCFPPQLSWLVRVLYDVLLTAKRTDTREVSAICVDLVFAFFLCPAMVTPEPYGICDAPISHISSFNLMQVRFLLITLPTTILLWLGGFTLFLARFYIVLFIECSHW